MTYQEYIPHFRYYTSGYRVTVFVFSSAGALAASAGSTTSNIYCKSMNNTNCTNIITIKVHKFALLYTYIINTLICVIILLPFLTAMKPTLAQLNILKTTTGEKIKIIESVAPQWKELGDLLDFDHEGRTLELIEANNQQKSRVESCREMFVYWLRGKGREATWGVLIELLDDIDQSELAKKVKTALHI